MENQRTVYHRSHRPWKSLRDYQISAIRRLGHLKQQDNEAELSPIQSLVRVSQPRGQSRSVTTFPSLYFVSHD